MTELKELLERASESTTVGAAPLADDLARGRKALRKRRAGMAGGVLAGVMLVTGAGGFAVARSGATPREATPAGHTQPHHSPTPSLAPYAGSMGDRPLDLSYIPRGWKEQGWSPSAVVLVHADGSPRTTVLDFEGKIAIIHTSTPIPRTGTVKTVDGKQFRVTEYSPSKGSPGGPVVADVTPDHNHSYVQVQGPRGTDPAQLLKIAAGVTVTANADSPAIG